MFLFGALTRGITRWLPGVSTIKSVLAGAVAVGLLSAGVWLGVWFHSWGEPKRIAVAAAPLCDAANSKASLAALQESLQAGELELAQRELEMGRLTEKLATLEAEMAANQKGSLDASYRSIACLPPGALRVQPVQKRP